ncbi:9088_t:CDS:2 [Ambispora gerdemannii]|uniref:9088_t:CDS:1 n=1 Tax=Ambispora gerdemannii TaxID=144530 RepID=A0A9N8VBK7_9GLOM|nr:9088_t:CDS:2 [Ambispora gerdemannii]
MKNNFINNNGVILLNTNKKQAKTKVEIQSIVGDQSQIEALKQQEQAIIAELSEVNKFSSKFLSEAVKAKKEKENHKVEFALKFDPAVETFTDLICQKITNQVSYLKSQLSTIQQQLSHQERIFARIEARRQGRELLTCQYKNRLGCIGVYRCDNCQEPSITQIIYKNLPAVIVSSIFPNRTFVKAIIAFM